MKVCVLENGRDHIIGVFSSRELADAAAVVFHDDVVITEYEVDEGAQEIREGCTPWFVRLHRESGDVLQCWVYATNTTDYPSWMPSVDVWRDINNNLFTTVWARDREHAITIAGDRRRMYLARP